MGEEGVASRALSWPFLGFRILLMALQPRALCPGKAARGLPRAPQSKGRTAQDEGIQGHSACKSQLCRAHPSRGLIETSARSVLEN